MSIDIGEPLAEGIDRLTESNGLTLVGIFVLLGLVSSLLAADLVATVLEDAVARGDIDVNDVTGVQNPLLGDDPTDPIIGLPFPVSVAGLLLTALAYLSTSVAAARTFASEETERIPGEYFTHKLGWALLNVVVGGILFGIVLSIGFTLFILPGLVLLVVFYFWPFPVVVEDQSFVAGFSESLSLTSGNRLALFLLGVIVALVALVVNGIGTVLSASLPSLLGTLVGGVFSAVSFVFTVAVAARTYRALERDRSRRPATDETMF